MRISLRSPKLWILPFLLVAVAGSALAQPGVIQLPHEVPPPPPEGESQALSHTHCEDGSAGGYPCSDVDLFAFLPRSAVGAVGQETLNDIWGWTDPQTGREYVLLGLAGGTSFVDITDPTEPRFLGELPTQTIATAWRDIKTYRDHAFIVADGSGGHGMQIFDLSRLRSVAASPRTFQADAVYRGPGLGKKWGIPFGPAHNLALNEDTGYAYIVGSDSCQGGLHAVDVREPQSPRFAGCFEGDGYTHDAQCVAYRGPDAAFSGREVCFAANEDTVTVVDVDDKSAPELLARVGYSNVGYTHQLWLTEDHRFLLSNDELDELQFGNRTRTLIWDVSNLRNPVVMGTYLAKSPSSDHNLYVAGGLAYEANYRSGLRILDLSRIGAGQLQEVAFFDIVPESDQPGFVGAWSVYPFFDSGTVAVSGIQQGLFLLDPFAGHHEDGESALLAPKNFRLQPAGNLNLLRWRDTSSGEAGFRVYRSLDGATAQVIAELAAGKTSFLDPQDGAALYTYRITAILAGEESAPVTKTLDLSAPAAPPAGPIKPQMPHMPHGPGL